MSNTTFGATVIRPQELDGDKKSTLAPTLESPALTPATSHEDLTPCDSRAPAAIQTPFYALAPPDPAHSRQTRKIETLVDEKDVEACVSTPLSTGDKDNPFTSKVSVDCNKEDKMWPSKQTLLQCRMAEKKRKRDGKGCGGCRPVVEWWARFSKKQKLAIEFAIVIFVIGAAVAIGVGISIAVHGPVFKSVGQSAQIPQPS